MRRINLVYQHTRKKPRQIAKILSDAPKHSSPSDTCAAVTCEMPNLEGYDLIESGLGPGL